MRSGAAHSSFARVAELSRLSYVMQRGAFILVTAVPRAATLCHDLLTIRPMGRNDRGCDDSEILRGDEACRVVCCRRLHHRSCRDAGERADEASAAI